MSETTSDQIPWIRYWCELGASINCEDDNRGFLADPSGDYGKFINPNTRRLEELIPEIGPLILCGEPGIGKSTELSSLRKTLAAQQESTGEAICAIKFRDVSDIADFRRRTVERPQWLEWTNGSGRLTMIVDGVDEGLLRVPNFVNDLTGLLSDQPLSRLRVILACRSAEWPAQMGDRFTGLWNLSDRKALFELCPLRRVDAVVAAENRGADPESFMGAVFEKRATGLASRPMTLFFLLREFRANDGNLPATHRELYERGVENLVREIDPARVELLRSLRKAQPWATDQARLAAAQLIAAMLLCTGKSAVRRSNAAFSSDSNSDLSMADCCRVDGAGGSTVTEGALDEAVESALFTSLGPGRFGFIHQTIAECLASQHLAAMPLVQLRSLLCQRDERGEHVVPQLAELAAWVAGYNNEFGSLVLVLDPETLLRSDVAKTSDDFKRRLVAAILDGAKEERIFDNLGFGRFLSSLAHPGLAEQLRPVIGDPTVNYVTRRIAISIARECKVTALYDPILKLARDSSEGAHMRSQAMHALEEIIPNDRLADLEPMARGEVGDDPDDDLRGTALRALIPKFWKVRDAIGALKKQNRPSYVGSYSIVLRYHLPQHMGQEDVRPLLAWLQQNLGAFDTLSSRYKLAIKTVVMAFDNIDDPLVLGAYIDLWRELASDHHQHTLTGHKEIADVLDGNRGLRHKITEALLNHGEMAGYDQVFGVLYDAHLIIDVADFEFLLDQIPTTPANKRANWAEAIKSCYGLDFMTRTWDKFLARLAAVPELAAVFPWVRVWVLDEADSKKAKAEWLERKRLHQKLERRRRGDDEPDVPALTQRALDRARHEAPDAWYQFWQCMMASFGPAGAKTWDPNVQSCPGWTSLGEEDRELARKAARSFLMHHSDKHSEWMAGSYLACAAIAAIWQLRDTLEKDSALRKTIDESWISVCAQPYFADDDNGRELFSFFYALNGPASARALCTAAEADGKKSGHMFALRAASKCWDAALSAAVHDLLTTITVPKAVDSAIDAWSDCDPSAARDFCFEYLESNEPMDGLYPLGLKRALVCCLSRAPDRAMTVTDPILSADDVLARSVWLEVLHDHDLRQGSWYATLTERALGDLYLKLIRLFPRREDPKFEGGLIPPEHSAAEARDRIPGILSARATESSCAELLRLADALPNDSTNLRWTYRNAVTNLRKAIWDPHPPQDVLRLVERPNTRLVDNEDDLLAVALESFARLQIELTGSDLPSSEDLWKWSGAGQQRKDFEPKDEDALCGKVARWLSRDLGPKSGVVINREVQPRRGSRTDVQVNAVANPGTAADLRVLTLVIEVKGCWHADVRTAMHSQLADGYLKDNGWRGGIYAVGWFVCPHWSSPKNKTGCDTIEDTQKFLDAEVSPYDGVNQRKLVRAVVLDCTLTSGPPSGR